MEKKQKFSLRKLKNGVASVAIGALLVSASAIDVEASPTDETSVDEKTEEQAPETPGESKDETQSLESDDLIVEVDTGETEEVIVSEPVVERHQGSDREEVAINVAEEHFSDAEKAIIVNQDKYTDAISATNISQGEYPVLYTRADKIGDKTLVSLGRMENLKEIYLLGGTTSIDQSIEDRLTDIFHDITITRIDGVDRFEANAKAIRETFLVETDGPEAEVEDKIVADHIVIASGETYTDALYGVSYANTINAPIILSKTDRLVEESVQLIEDLGARKVTIIGGEASVTQAVKDQLASLGIELENINRIAGATRYDGSVEVARKSYENPETVLIASGDIFTDALVSAPLAQKLNAPIILVRKDSMVEEVEKYLNDNYENIKTIYIQGGESTINKVNADNIKYAASEKVTQPIMINAVLTLQVTDENTVEARFVNSEEEYDETHTVELEEPLVDGEEKEITFTFEGKEYTAPVLYVTPTTFVAEIGLLKNVDEIKKMDVETLAAQKVKIEKARTFYNALTEEAREVENVITNEDYLTRKEIVVGEREKELEEAEA